MRTRLPTSLSTGSGDLPDMVSSPLFASPLLFRLRMESASPFTPLIGFATAPPPGAGPLDLCFPHAGREPPLVRADNVRIDSGRAERGAAEPALNEARRDIGLEGVHAEAVPKALRHCLRAGNAGRRHDGLDVAPRRCPAPAPKAHRCKVGIALPATDLKMPPELLHKLG